MSTPFDIFGVIGRTGKKHVARLVLPYGLQTDLVNVTLVTGSTATTSGVVPPGSSFVYNGMLEDPAGSGIFSGQCDVEGADLPDSDNRPYTVEVVEVDPASDITTYAGCQDAYEGAPAYWAALGVTTFVKYARGVPETIGTGYLAAGEWGDSSSAGGVNVTRVNGVDAPVSAVPGFLVVDVRAVNGEPADPVDAPFAIQGIYQAVVTNPRYQTRDLPPIAQGSEPTEIWAITDQQGTPIDLTGKTFRFVAYLRTDTGTDQESVIDDTIAASFEYASGAGITLGGAAHNEVTLKHDAAKTATPGNFRYWLWNVTDKLPLAKGKCPIEPAVFDL